MRSLFEISEDLHFLQDFLSDTGGDITEEAMEAEIDKWLGDLGEERDIKIDNYCALIREFQARSDARAGEAERIEALSRVDKNAAESLKSRLLAFFNVHELDKVETARFRVSRVNNGGALPVIIDTEVLDDPESLPEAYRKVVYQPNRTQIVEDLQLLEAARLRAEDHKKTWDALEENIAKIKKALAENTTEERLEELGRFEAVYDENLKELQDSQKAYEELQAALSFARFGERGKHLRIK